jgi:LytS/YehU family sensor histidine kinase
MVRNEGIAPSIGPLASSDGPVIRMIEPPPEIASGMLIRSFIVFALTTGIAVAIHTTSQWFRSEERRKDLEREHLKSELSNLKNQLNPHFFFNTLNNIYSLISQDQQRAGDAVLQLGKLMRYLLYESNEKFVTLAKEVEFMHHYIDLMKLRLTSNIVVRYSFAFNTSGYSIAPLLFISLIENSFKHGVSSLYPSEIEMDLRIVDYNKLTFSIRNTSFPKNENDHSGSGIGLDNLRKRLNLLYPGKHTLITKTQNSFYQTVLTVEL